MSGYEVIKGQLQMLPPPPHQWQEAKKTGLSGVQVF